MIPEASVDTPDPSVGNCQITGALSYEKGDVPVVFIRNRSLHIPSLIIREAMAKLKIEWLLAKSR